MKKVALYLITLVFAANTIVVTAAFDPCLTQDMANHSNHHIEEAEKQINNESCHEEKQQNSHDCEQACFCLAYSINNMPLFDDQAPQQKIRHYVIFSLTDEVIAAGYYQPLYRPPILIS